MATAKYKNEGYCPEEMVRSILESNDFGDKRLIGLWSLIGSRVVCEKGDEYTFPPVTVRCDELFTSDPIAYNVLSTIVKRNVNADKILVHQLQTINRYEQRASDIQKTLKEATNPQLLVCKKSNFIVIIADASYGIDVWFWYLPNCK